MKYSSLHYKPGHYILFPTTSLTDRRHSILFALYKCDLFRLWCVLSGCSLKVEDHDALLGDVAE